MNTSNYEEVIDKLLKIELEEVQDVHKVWTNPFEEAFNEYYTTIHPCLGLFTFLTWFVTFRTWIAKKMLVQISFT